MKYLKKVASTPLDQTEGHIIDSFNTSDDHTTNAPSLNAVESNYVGNPTVLYDGEGTNGTVNLSDSSYNYRFLEIYFKTNDGWNFRGYQKCKISNGNPTIHVLQFVHCSTAGGWWIKSKEVSINDRTITNNAYIEIYSGGATVSNYIYITHVLGYK